MRLTETACRTTYAHMTTQEAEAFWSTREWKKWVVTLERGPVRRPEREVKYVRATSRSQAIACARRNAMTVKSPSRVSCRLATAQDLGCVLTPGVA